MPQRDDTPSPGAPRARLTPMHALSDFRLAAGEPDIRGWDVVGPDGQRLGTVDELLVDATRAEVSAVAVRAAGARTAAADDPLVLPMERVRIDDARRTVLSDLTGDELVRAAQATSAPTDASARRIRDVASDPAAHPGVTVERTGDGGEVIRVPIVEEELVVERRPVVKEVVVIRKRAVQEERVVEADVRRERVEVDRHDAGPRDDRR